MSSRSLQRTDGLQHHSLDIDLAVVVVQCRYTGSQLRERHHSIRALSRQAHPTDEVKIPTMGVNPRLPAFSSRPERSCKQAS